MSDGWRGPGRGRLPPPRMVLTFAWLRWRLAINHLKSGLGRDSLEQLARASEVVGMVLLALLSIPLLFACSIGSVVLGWVVAHGDLDLAKAETAIRSGLMASILIMAFLALAMGANQVLPQLARFLLLPIDRRQLHTIHTLAGALDPWMLALLLPLAGVPLGLVLGGRPLLAALSLPAGAAFGATLLAIQSLVHSGGALLVRRPRAATVTLVVLGIVLGAGVPVLAALEDEIGAEVVQALWYVDFPGELFMAAFRAAADGRIGIALAATAGLGAIALVILLVSEKTYERVLLSALSGGPPRKKKAGRSRSFKIPLVPPSVSAVAVVQVRTLLRSGIGLIGLIQAPIMMLVLGWVMAKMEREISDGLGMDSLFLILLFGTLGLSHLTTIQVAFNQYACDGAGLTMLHLMPIPPRDLLRGKAVGWGSMTALSAVLTLVLGLVLVRPPLAASTWIVAVCALSVLAYHLVLSPAAAATSAFLPRKLELKATFRRNQPHPFAGIAGMASLMVAWGVPMGIGIVGYSVLKRPEIAVALLALWCGVAYAVYRLGLWGAAEVWKNRREALWLTITS